MRTDWSKRWPDQTAMQNRDAVPALAHHPGWSKDVLKLLYEDRQDHRLGSRNHGY